ncbi:595_t:CDS:2, partial [Racocetra persica]
AEVYRNVLNDYLKQFITLRKHWNQIESIILKKFSNQCNKATILFNNLIKENVKEDEYKADLNKLKKITIEYSQEINNFLKTEWVNKLNPNMFQMAVINLAIDNYNKETLFLYVNFIDMNNNKGKLSQTYQQLINKIDNWGKIRKDNNCGGVFGDAAFGNGNCSGVFVD